MFMIPSTNKLVSPHVCFLLKKRSMIYIATMTKMLVILLHSEKRKCGKHICSEAKFVFVSLFMFDYQYRSELIAGM